MDDTFYKPLTPAFRSDIDKAIDNNIADLSTCQSNAIVSAQIAGQRALKNLINALPDGYPMPMAARKN